MEPSVVKTDCISIPNWFRQNKGKWRSTVGSYQDADDDHYHFVGGFMFCNAQNCALILFMEKLQWYLLVLIWYYAMVLTRKTLFPPKYLGSCPQIESRWIHKHIWKLLSSWSLKSETTVFCTLCKTLTQHQLIGFSV